ncbi:unnamed protein product [Prunus brigantina]
MIKMLSWHKIPKGVLLKMWNHCMDVVPKTSSVRVCSHSGNSDERDSTIIEILEEIVKGIIKQLEGQDSMDDSRQNHRVLVADILNRNDEEDEEDDMNSESDDIAEGVGESSHRKWVLLHCVYESCCNEGIIFKWKILSH